MPESIKKLSPEDIEVNKIIRDTKIDVSKIEGDIKKLQERGTKEFQLRPSWAKDDIDRQQIIKSVETFKENIDTIKSSALSKIEKAVEHLPDTEKNIHKEAAQKQLYPEQQKDKQEMKNSFADRFSQGLGVLSHFNKEQEQKEISPSKFISPQKIAGEKEK